MHCRFNKIKAKAINLLKEWCWYT